MTPQQTNNPFLRFKARSIFLRGLFLSLSLGLALGLLGGFTTISPTDAIVTPVLYILILSLLCLWVLRQFKRLHVYPRYIIGQIPSNQNWWRMAGLVLALMVFSLGAFQVSFSVISFAVPSFVEAVLRSLQASTEPKTALPVLYNLLNAIALVVVAPITEEFIFRGILLQRWAVKWNVPAGLLVSSLIFGVLHTNIVGLSMFGLVMGLLYLKSRTLVVPIACHALNNLTVLAIGFLPRNSNPAATVSALEQLRSGWWAGLLMMAITGFWLVRFIYKSFPRKNALIPYFANSMTIEHQG